MNDLLLRLSQWRWRGIENQVHKFSLILEFWSREIKCEWASLKCNVPSLVFVVFIFYIKNVCLVPKRAKVIREEKSLIFNDSRSLPSLRDFIGNCFDISSAVNYFNDASTTLNSYLWKWFSSLICGTPEHININTIQRSRRTSFAIILKSKLNLFPKKY